MTALLDPRRFILAALLALMPVLSASGQSVQSIRDAAHAALEDRFPEAADRLTVRVQRTGGDLRTGAAFRLSFPSDGTVPRGPTQVRVLHGSDAAGWDRAGWALLKIAHFDSVAVANRDVRGGDALLPEDVDVAWMETTRFRGEPLTGADFRAMTAAGSALAARYVRAGRALRRGDVRPPYAVDTGEAVVMHYRRKGFDLRLDCKAREPGQLDEVIRIYSPTTKASYRARLTAPNTALWIETL